MSKERYLPGISVLLRDYPDWIKGRRVALVAHPASIDETGIQTADRLRARDDVTLACLFGPEHGFDGQAAPGQIIESSQHTQWDIPVYSLYGKTPKPTPEMLADVDVILYDLQDLGVRCYTYVTTLRFLLQSAAETGTSVIVADRPVPLPQVVDGPVLEPSFTSFVGYVPTPLVYGMTSGETAFYLVNRLGLKVDLKVAPMQGYTRDMAWPTGMPWVPPSPAIRSWRAAQTYAATVFAEAFPELDYGRNTLTSFRVIGAPGIDADDLADLLNWAGLTGVDFYPHSWRIMAGARKGEVVRGIRLEIKNAEEFRPCRAAVTILSALIDHCKLPLWKAKGSRPEFFDKLMGTDRIRVSLQAKIDPKALFVAWEESHTAFLSVRQECLRYG